MTLSMRTVFFLFLYICFIFIMRLYCIFFSPAIKNLSIQKIQFHISDSKVSFFFCPLTGDLHESDMHSDLYLRWLSETENAARKTQLPLKAMGAAFSELRFQFLKVIAGTNRCAYRSRVNPPLWGDPCLDD